METRTIPELLQVLLDNEEYFESGLCHLSGELCLLDIISREEESNIDDYIDLYAPKSFDDDGDEYQYRFKRGQWPPRKEWLQKQIEYSKNFES